MVLLGHEEHEVVPVDEVPSGRGEHVVEESGGRGRHSSPVNLCRGNSEGAHFVDVDLGTSLGHRVFPVLVEDSYSSVYLGDVQFP